MKHENMLDKIARHLIPFDGNMFDWRDGTGTAYASKLGFPARKSPPTMFAVRSHRTGKVKIFVLDKDFTELHGDGYTAVYTSTDDVRVCVYNDVDDEPVGW